MALSASVPTRDYTPGSKWTFTSTGWSSWDLTDGKWARVQVRKDEYGPVLFETTLDGSYISATADKLTVVIPPSATNDLTGGENFGTVMAMFEEFEWNCDLGLDSDTSVVEYRLQGKLRVLPTHGTFTESPSS